MLETEAALLLKHYLDESVQEGGSTVLILAAFVKTIVRAGNIGTCRPAILCAGQRLCHQFAAGVRNCSIDQ
jgi:hypothetical protein